ncbi:hypothetical protein D8B26_000195 [Coccidioides posadasii str. Silveira]|nr:hypothetical protein CPC735_065980 [Coccidioides posadasii C735 delta SOWgp]EER25498.1 hypothetical protein CPC735_065980 [Coccidioides posadasii C735 delta SOWgp]KMM70867.1 hypothetical protein CPAG_07176 [Coccidioides posadasii RMSCC 3488]QVM05489.1 hypothetical protein D8B26_000195 [Coccidioides posadasii str. Silveira]|eukprot:XP_003067643.1 hypothetical protein CPC735_065980 [Coccidioides posadasii C735 delta SOWgp]
MAPLPDTPAGRPPVLKAAYLAPATSPPDPAQPQAPLQHTFQHQLSTSLSSHTTDATARRTAYLSELRGAVVSLQGEVNAYLTARMEEDSARSARVEGKDETKEEENYGEEVVNEEEDED